MSELLQVFEEKLNSINAIFFFRAAVFLEDNVAAIKAYKMFPNSWRYSPGLLSGFYQDAILWTLFHDADFESRVFDVETWNLLRRWSQARSAPGLPPAEVVLSGVLKALEDEVEFELTDLELKNHVWPYIESLHKDISKILTDWIKKHIRRPTALYLLPENESTVFGPKFWKRTIVPRLAGYVSEDSVFRSKDQQWKLLFRFSDNPTAEAFHDAVDDQGPAIIVGKTSLGSQAELGDSQEVFTHFAAYNSDGWNSAGGNSTNLKGFVAAIRFRLMTELLPFKQMEISSYTRRKHDADLLDVEWKIVDEGRRSLPRFSFLDVGNADGRVVTGFNEITGLPATEASEYKLEDFEVYAV